VYLSTHHVCVFAWHQVLKKKTKREVLSPSCGLSLYVVRRLVLFDIKVCRKRLQPMLRGECFNVSQHKTSSNFENFFFSFLSVFIQFHSCDRANKSGLRAKASCCVVGIIFFICFALCLKRERTTTKKKES
jgi:hypothetical protein